MSAGPTLLVVAAAAFPTLAACRSTPGARPFAPEDAARFERPIALEAADGPIDVARRRGYAGPTLFDADRDGKLDLFVGSFDGKIAHHRNAGTARAPRFAAGVLLEADGAVLAISNW